MSIQTPMGGPLPGLPDPGEHRQLGLNSGFAHGDGADALPPGPALAALTGQALSQADLLSDDELIGVLHAARRLANLADYQLTVVIATFTSRRRAQLAASIAAGQPTGCRDGGFPGAELAMELMETPYQVGLLTDTAVELTTRLPRTLAGMASGQIDLGRAMAIAASTASLPDDDAARADEILAAAAPGKRPDQLARKASALEMKLNPEAVRARKERARQLDQRVEARREASGNASLSGRELAVTDVMASNAYIDSVARRLANAGVEGTLPRLRALTLIDLTQGRDPLRRLMPRTTAPGMRPGPPAQSTPGTAPLPAVINLIVPASTLLGAGNAPAFAAGWDLLDGDDTRAVVRAASRNPATRWCVTVTAPDGTAVAHGCAVGQHPWPVDRPGTTDGPPGNGPPPRDPGPSYGQQLHELLSRLGIEPRGIARRSCEHVDAENRYVPSRRLRHLIRARSRTCSAPACGKQAVHCDLDHTDPYPRGLTCQCNLTPKCRRHHRVKQAPGWTVSQPNPDTAVWTTPSGRTHVTRASVYDT